MPDTADFALTFCERNGIPREVALRVRLILEELLTNSIRHGYREECDSGIRIELDVVDGCPAIVYEDTAPPYDPLKQAAKTTREAPSVDAPPGGLGIVLIGKLARRASYAYEDERNRLSLVVAR